MFDLITGGARHIPGGGPGPILVSTTLHALALGAIITVPLLLMGDVLPEVPTMMAFVASVPPPPPPPPPVAKSVEPQRTQPTTSATAVPIPLDAPPDVIPEGPVRQEQAGVPGGVEGGVPGGVVGGVVGGIVSDMAPPPPPAPSGPVRIGGQIQQPRLVTRVEPAYPSIAANARIQGVVIVEATVDTEGRVKDVKVLRSVPLLDRAAVDAVMQWRYSPVTLNGKPVPFILTVVVSFSVPDGLAARN